MGRVSTLGVRRACFMSPPPTDCCGSLKRSVPLSACLRLTFALCVVRLLHRHQPLFLCTWNRAAGWPVVQTYNTHGCMRTHARRQRQEQISADPFDCEAIVFMSNYLCESTNKQGKLTIYFSDAFLINWWTTLKSCVCAEMYSVDDLMNAFYLSFPYARIYCFKEIRLILLTFRHFYYFLSY